MTTQPSLSLHQIVLWIYIYIYIYIVISAMFYPIYPTPPLGQYMTQGQFFKRSLTGFNSEFSFSKTSCLNKAEEPSLSYYLPIAGGRIIGFIPFPRVLVLCEMQSVSSRIWTRIAVSISYDDNQYTTSTSSDEAETVDYIVEFTCTQCLFYNISPEAILYILEMVVLFNSTRTLFPLDCISMRHFISLCFQKSTQYFV